MAKRNVTAPYGTIDDTGRVELSLEVMKKTGQNQQRPQNSMTGR